MDLEYRNSYNQSLDSYHLKYLIEETQIQRWSNWVKTIAIFIMFESIAFFIFIMSVQIIPTPDKDIYPSWLVYFAHADVFIMAYLGYITSISKTSKCALNYLIALTLAITFEVINLISILDDTMDSCKKKKNNNDCGSYWVLVFLFILAIIYFSSLFYCSYRLYKSRKELEIKVKTEQDLELNDSGYSV